MLNGKFAKFFKVKFESSIILKDNSILKVEGDNVVNGAKIYLVTNDGINIPIPNGEYPTFDDKMIVVQDGIVVDVYNVNDKVDDFITTELLDGSTIKIINGLNVGSEVYLLTNDGDLRIGDGLYQLKTGTLITCKDSIIEQIVNDNGLEDIQKNNNTIMEDNMKLAGMIDENPDDKPDNGTLPEVPGDVKGTKSKTADIKTIENEKPEDAMMEEDKIKEMEVKHLELDTKITALEDKITALENEFKAALEKFEIVNTKMSIAKEFNESKESEINKKRSPLQESRMEIVKQLGLLKNL